MFKFAIEYLIIKGQYEQEQIFYLNYAIDMHNNTTCINKNNLIDMITRTQYLEALALIDVYHRQHASHNVSNTRKNKKWIDLEIGDYIVFNSVASKSITIGKKYLITDVDDDWADTTYSYYTFYDDKGKKRSMKKRTQGCSVKIYNEEEQVLST